MKKALSLLVIFLQFAALAQQKGGAMAGGFGQLKGRVYGKIVDAKTGKPVEFCAVAVVAMNSDSVIGGALARENGEFSIEQLPARGTFRLRAIQVGYQTVTRPFAISPPDKLEQDLGNITLQPDAQTLREVEVVAEKATVNMSIDKRTYNVDKDLSARGGTAVDAMKNVPGLTVDADGNVSLRSQAPMVFVDGRPTQLTLQQIPADQIDRIEVITNPSVKFDAAATGGIVNIVMKKNLKPGYNGMLMAYAGTGDRYGGMVNLGMKESRTNLSAMVSYNQAINQTMGYTRRTQIDSGRSSGYFNQDNLTWQQRNFLFGKLGLDHALTNRNTISVNQMIMSGWFNTSDRQEFRLLDADRNETAAGTRVNDQDVHFEHYNTQLQFRHTYPRPGREFTADVNYGFTHAASGYSFNTYADPRSLQLNSAGSKARQGVLQLDYVDPLSEHSKLEFGVKSFYKVTYSHNNTFNSTPADGLVLRDSLLSNNYVIDDMVNAAYVNYSSQTFWNIAYQAGLRFEHSYYKGHITDHDVTFSYQYPSGTSDLLNAIFPGIYFSRKFTGNQEWQLNFSRKIQRPHFFQLMPFVMFADRQNYRIGNPQLRPEFRNIGELNYSKNFEKGSYLGSGYFRYEEQPITDVAYPSPDDPDVLVNTPINADDGYRYGMEHTLKLNFARKLDVTLNLNAYNVFVRGRLMPGLPEVTTSGYAFDAKAIVNYRFPNQWNLQLNGNYQSPRVLLLGNTLPVYSADLSLAKTVRNKWTFNLSVNDIFNTRRMGTHFVTPFYEQELSRRRESRYVRFSISYIFGKSDSGLFRRARTNRSSGENQNQDGLDFGG